MGIVAGLDSSPDFTRIVVCDSDTGAVLRQGYAPHPVEGDGRPSDVDPQAWLLSLGEAAGGGPEVGPVRQALVGLELRLVDQRVGGAGEEDAHREVAVGERLLAQLEARAEVRLGRRGHRRRKMRR